VLRSIDLGSRTTYDISWGTTRLSCAGKLESTKLNVTFPLSSLELLEKYSTCNGSFIVTISCSTIKLMLGGCQILKYEIDHDMIDAEIEAITAHKI